MCGIAGQVRFDATADRAEVERLTNAVAHRGPDGGGFWVDANAMLGHRRLAIIDIAGGTQPMVSQNGELVLVFNGEIYNYLELRSLLQNPKARHTSSDTAVLLELFAQKGPACVSLLRGMFAFVIWNTRTRTLFAARDRFGKKPLYFRNESNRLTFSSELKALQRSDDDLSPSAVDAFLERLYIPAPHTILRGVSALSPAHYLERTEHSLVQTRYWTAPVPGSDSNEPDRSEIFERLRTAVRLRLRSDVPVGALLSGGIDSSIVVALMADELGAGVPTYSVGFGRPDDELPAAAAVAKMHRTNHHELTVALDLPSLVPEALGAWSEPFGDSSAIPMYALCKEVGANVRVALTGDGGDELFGGYGGYQRIASLPRLPRAIGAAAGLPISDRATRAIRTLSSTGENRYRSLTEVFNARSRVRLLGRQSLTKECSTAHGLGDVDAAIAFDLAQYLPNDINAKADIASMAWALELRSPFQDHVLAESVVPLRSEYKLSRAQNKLLLREFAQSRLPPQILASPKRGFGSPIHAWLSGPLRPLANDLLRGKHRKLDGVLNPRAVDQVVKREAATNPHQLWALLVLELWLRRRS